MFWSLCSDLGEDASSFLTPLHKTKVHPHTITWG